MEGISLFPFPAWHPDPHRFARRFSQRADHPCTDHPCSARDLQNCTFTCACARHPGSMPGERHQRHRYCHWPEPLQYLLRSFVRPLHRPTLCPPRAAAILRPRSPPQMARIHPEKRRARRRCCRVRGSRRCAALAQLASPAHLQTQAILISDHRLRAAGHDQHSRGDWDTSQPESGLRNPRRHLRRNLRST